MKQWVQFLVTNMRHFSITKHFQNTLSYQTVYPRGTSHLPPTSSPPLPLASPLFLLLKCLYLKSVRSLRVAFLLIHGYDFLFNPVTYSFEICLYMMEEPGRLQSMGLWRVGHDWVTSFSLFTFKHWRRKWQPTPVFLPGESQRRGSLVGCHLWDCTESATTEVT